MEGSQGWEEFLAGKQEMLDDYDRAKTKNKNKPVYMEQGNVAEASFRRWLGGFLPKKYAVTSGYIVSQRSPDTVKNRHYDVIIYDQLESPVLWVEKYHLSSEHSVRAIPVEHIHGVFEVKSSLDRESSKRAIGKLDELRPLLESVDKPEEVFKSHFPSNFVMGIVFFELLEKNAKNGNIDVLDILRPRKHYRGYMNSLVLRGEGLDPRITGRIFCTDGIICSSKKRMNSGSLLVHPTPYSKPYKINSGRYQTNFLYWAPAMFSTYMFDLVAIMNGTYKPGIVSSMHGMNWGSKFQRH